MDLQFAAFGHMGALIRPCRIGRYHGDASGLRVKLEMPVLLSSDGIFFFNLFVCLWIVLKYRLIVIDGKISSIEWGANP